ncbi:MAG: hypothetical protein OXD01_12020 [Gammaproteobacteria bacterium]|nr:hypothetical protein [Gammaproteobacteria bacterium]
MSSASSPLQLYHWSVYAAQRLFSRKQTSIRFAWSVWDHETYWMMPDIIHMARRLYDSFPQDSDPV